MQKKNAISGITGVFLESFLQPAPLPWICPAMAPNPRPHKAGCAQPNQGLGAFIQDFPAEPLQFNTSIRANQRFSKPPSIPAATCIYIFCSFFLRIMTHAQCFKIKAPHSLCSLSSSTLCFFPQNPCTRWSQTYLREGWKGEPGLDLTLDPARRCCRGNAQHPYILFLSKAGASQELKGPSDLFVARSLKRSSDVFAYLEIRERQEDERMKGKSLCTASTNMQNPALTGTTEKRHPLKSHSSYWKRQNL